MGLQSYKEPFLIQLELEGVSQALGPPNRAGNTGLGEGGGHGHGGGDPVGRCEWVECRIIIIFNK